MYLLEDQDYDFHCVHCGQGGYFEVGPGMRCHKCGKWPDTPDKVEEFETKDKIRGFNADYIFMDGFEFDEDDDFEEMW